MRGENSQNQLYNKGLIQTNAIQICKPSSQALLTSPNKPMYPWVPNTPSLR